MRPVTVPGRALAKSASEPGARPGRGALQLAPGAVIDDGGVGELAGCRRVEAQPATATGGPVVRDPQQRAIEARGAADVEATAESGPVASYHTSSHRQLTAEHQDAAAGTHFGDLVTDLHLLQAEIG